MLSNSVTRLQRNALELAVSVGKLLRQNQLTLAVAESATGGLIGHYLTEVAGSSDYFLGAVIAYANSVKQSLLHIPEATLDQHGAVSEQTVLTMAQIVRQVLGADLGLATSGIAGPTGARPNKPIGLVFVSIAQYPDQPIVRSYKFEGSRSENKIHFATAAFQLLQDTLSRKTTS